MIRRLVDKPIAVTMTLVAVIILGIISANMLPVSLMPDVAAPYITVQVSAPGYSAREVNASLITPLNSQLEQISDVRELKAESYDDGGKITMQFNYGTNLDFLFIEVNEKIDRATNSLPRNLDRPKVIKASATDIPAFYINITVPSAAYDSTAFTDLSMMATQVIAKRMEQVPSIAMVDISGTVFPEIMIIPDKEKLDGLGIGVSDIESALNKNNINLGNLTIRDGEYIYSVRFENSITGKADIENIYLNIHQRLYKIGDLAEVIEKPQPAKNIDRSDGSRAITLAVIKQSDAKMKELKNDINSVVSSLQSDYPQLNFTITRDQTLLLDYSIDNLWSNIVMAAILACLIVFFFMGDFRSPFLIAITIPISLIVAFLLFRIFDMTINIISLSGLILGIGMMVDNSIIVIDNITQYWERKFELKESIVRGTNEVFTPMLSSVLTTCSVFIPLIFLSGITGALFYDQAMAVIIGLFASLAVAVLVIPVYYFLIYKNKKEPGKNKYLIKIDITPKMLALYERMLKAVFRKRIIVWLLLLLFIPATYLIYLKVEKEQLPPITYDDTILYVDWNDMITIEENDRRIGSIINRIGDLLSQYTSMAGPQQFLLAHTQELTSSECIVYLKANKASDIPVIQSSVSKYLADSYPGAISDFRASGNVFEMVFGNSMPPLRVYLKPNDGGMAEPDKLNNLLRQISLETPSVNISPIMWREHILLIPRTDMLTLYNVDYSTLLNSLRNSLNQNQFFVINNGAIPIPVLSGQTHRTIEILDGTVKSRDNIDVPLRTLLLETIDRDFKTITSDGVMGNYYPVDIYASASEIPGIMKQVKNTVHDNGSFEAEFSGSYFSNREIIKEMILVLLVAVMLLYLILAVQFESLVQPIIILLEIVIDICVVLAILYVFGSSINLMSLIGIVVMCGIVINDSILKVDTINKLRKDGYSLLRAIMTAGSRRLKPIVMTSLTTIFAVLPFLSRGNMGDDLQYPLSLVIIGGMTVGTLVSIFVLPLAYYEIYRRKK